MLFFLTFFAWDTLHQTQQRYPVCQRRIPNSSLHRNSNDSLTLSTYKQNTSDSSNSTYSIHLVIPLLPEGTIYISTTTIRIVDVPLKTTLGWNPTIPFILWNLLVSTFLHHFVIRFARLNVITTQRTSGLWWRVVSVKRFSVHHRSILWHTEIRNRNETLL